MLAVVVTVLSIASLLTQLTPEYITTAKPSAHHADLISQDASRGALSPSHLASSLLQPFNLLN
jgi:hypothetical protein